jgi:hypothetical protein
VVVMRIAVTAAIHQLAVCRLEHIELSLVAQQGEVPVYRRQTDGLAGRPQRGINALRAAEIVRAEYDVEHRLAFPRPARRPGGLVRDFLR